MNKILIIEDDPVVSRIYSARLEKEGYVVDVCSDGQAGFYRIHEFGPDVILLDLMLPNINGIEILKRIRSQKEFQNLPIIVFTNAYVQNMIQEALAAGASHVFNKSMLTPRQVIDALHTLSDDIRFPNPKSIQRENPQPFTQIRDRGTKQIPPEKPTLADSQFCNDQRQVLVDSSSETIGGLRKSLQEVTKAQNDTQKADCLIELYRKVHSLTGAAGITGLEAIGQMAAGLEVLLRELHEKPKNVTPSTLRTVAHSIDFIADLFKVTSAYPKRMQRANILVVDDEILSRRAVTYALEKADLPSINVDDPAVALTMAAQHNFDLIFLDVQMPGMDGFELCSRIRSLPTNKTTPIVFITSLTDFRSRARSTLSGGTDLIAKPFMFIELTVEALTHVMRGQITHLTRAQAA